MPLDNAARQITKLSAMQFNGSVEKISFPYILLENVSVETFQDQVDMGIIVRIFVVNKKMPQEKYLSLVF